MAKGTVISVNRALHRPILVAGVEKRLACLNGLIAFLLVAASHCHLPWAFLGVVQYLICHALLMMVSKHDPQLGSLFRQNTRYSWRAYFPAYSDPRVAMSQPVASVRRP